jgi:hypothetical protein
MTICPLTVS